MNKQQKQLKKKKDREARNLAKKLRVRKAIDKKNQENKKEYLFHKQMQKNRRQLAKMEAIADEIMDKIPAETREKIEKNIEILKALEEEYLAEVENRKLLNQKLEEQGLETLEDKMTALTQNLQAEQMAAGLDTPVETVEDAPVPTDEEHTSCTGECAD